MKFANNTHSQKRSKLGQIRMVSDISQNTKHSHIKNSTKSKASKLSLTSSSLQESIRPAININFKEAFKDISKEIPSSLLCNLCKNLVKNPTKCYQCKALFCKECLFVVLNKNKKCPKCFKIISKNLLKNAKLDQEFKNTFIKCKYTGCKEKINLFDYESHLQKCAFKDIKDDIQIDNLVYFNTLPIKEDPYSNSILMDYSIKNAENEIQLNNNSTFIEDNNVIEKQYEDISDNNAIEEIFKNILENAKKFEEDIIELENKKKEGNEIIRQMQTKISLEEMS